jgi:hypothetical protein
VSALLAAAFRALGPGPSREAEMRVQEALWESGDAETLRILEEVPGCSDLRTSELVRIAEANGSSAFVALDLITDLTKIRRGKPVVEDGDDAPVSAELLDDESVD